MYVGPVWKNLEAKIWNLSPNFVSKADLVEEGGPRLRTMKKRPLFGRGLFARC